MIIVSFPFMRLLITTVFVFIFTTISAQQINPLLVKNKVEQQKRWVDSIYQCMSLEEKIGQLFMTDVFSSDPKEKTNKVKDLIKNYHIGGIIFSKGGPKRQAKLNNTFQDISKIPLLIGMDAEWGLAMRLDSTFAYPWNMTLGAIEDHAIVEKIGKRIGVHSKRLGVHFNFAPVVDINTNPKNPIIGNRSFGEDRENVTEKAIAFMKGMQSTGVLANAKHFPGHGDTDADSHKTLPTLLFNKHRIDSLELYPYKQIIRQGLSSVMVAHLNIPAIVPEAGYPSSISKHVVTNMLMGELGFNGLIFTDALNMKGAANFKKPGEIDLAAFLAGNDVLLISEDIPNAHQLLVKAYKKGVITEKRLERSVRKILAAKYKVGLHTYTPVITNAITEALHTPKDDMLYEEAMEKALTIIKNDSSLLPIKELKNERYAYINFGDDSGKPFYNQLRKYASVDWVKANDLNSYIQKLKSYDKVIIGFHKSNTSPWKSYQFKSKELVWLYEIARTNKVILDVFTRPYALLDLKTTENFESIIVSYQNSKVAQELSAQLIFGARGASGSLPVSIGEDFPCGTSIKTLPLQRLSYGSPASVNLSNKKLKKIDSLVNRAISTGVMPGAQILVARKGKVVYQKNFGYHTPEKKRPVKSEDIYDVASLTKILATLPMVMKLVDKGDINLDTKLSELLPDYKNSNKAGVSLRQLLSHTARLQAWIPFYKQTLDSSTQKPLVKYFSKERTKKYSVPVAQNMFTLPSYKDTINQLIKESELRKRSGYKYSDLAYYVIKKYIEDFYKSPLDRLVQRNFYESLGASSTTYKPLDKGFKLQNIPPTENDTYFRRQKIQGYVHDQGAALLGGVGGHAGLFSNATDIAKIMQMYLGGGTYGENEYISSETIKLFNTCYYCDKKVRRGVGFDKPQLGNTGPTCGCVSMESFGHSGFTGTFTWADPHEEIVYVFLSNRTYPSASNKKIIKSNLRSDIQKIIYQAIVDR